MISLWANEIIFSFLSRLGQCDEHYQMELTDTTRDECNIHNRVESWQFT